MHQQIRIVCVYVALIVQKYNCIIGIHEFRLQGKKHKKRDGDREREVVNISEKSILEVLQISMLIKSKVTFIG